MVEPSTVYLENWHIDLIAEHLEAVTAGQIKRLLLNIAVYRRFRATLRHPRAHACRVVQGSVDRQPYRSLQSSDRLLRAGPPTAPAADA